MSFYNFARQVVLVVAHLRYRLRFEGLEHVPEGRGFILCSNHISMFDPILVAVKSSRSAFSWPRRNCSIINLWQR